MGLLFKSPEERATLLHSELSAKCEEHIAEKHYASIEANTYRIAFLDGVSETITLLQNKGFV